MKTLRVLKWTGAVVVLGGLAAGGYYGLRQARRVQAAADLPLAPVRKGDFAEIVRCRGEIAARRSVQLSAPKNIPDLKIVWRAEPGSHIHAGDVVVRFDASGAKRQLDEQTAALKQSKASLAQALAQARMTSEQDKLDLATAHYDVDRAKLEASKQAIVSVLQGESSKVDLATAESKLRVQEATVELHRKSDESKGASIQRQLEKAQADVDLTTERIGQTNMRAPGDGIIVYLTNYSHGWMNAQPFKVGDQVWPGAAVAEIPDTATLQMECKVDEVDRGRISRRATKPVSAPMHSPSKLCQSRVDSISRSPACPSSGRTRRTFIAYAPIVKAGCAPAARYERQR